jgi:CheY-like chemotaxis protein
MKKLKRPYVTAINGLESSEMYAACPSDYCCILTDISMPVMDGLESARRIRQHERANRLERQTPIIALTGLAGAGIQQDAVASGIDMFLTRPVTLKRLVEALESVGLDCTAA